MIAAQTPLNEITNRIAAAAQKAGRRPEDVMLMAVSKNQSPEAIQGLLAAGQRFFGENKVQEAARKYPALRARYPDIRLHMIGRLQTNKVAQAVTLFDGIESLDRPSLASELSKEINKQGRLPRLYIQINTGAETQKGGVLPTEAEAFFSLCTKHYGLTIKGVMGIPPTGEDPTPHFLLLRIIAARLSLPHISMGMSSDFEAAIAAGSTEVRLGRALFGSRI